MLAARHPNYNLKFKRYPTICLVILYYIIVYITSVSNQPALKTQYKLAESEHETPG